jgi:hypothetical protein
MFFLVDDWTVVDVVLVTATFAVEAATVATVVEVKLVVLAFIVKFEWLVLTIELNVTGTKDKVLVVTFG